MIEQLDREEPVRAALYALVLDVSASDSASNGALIQSMLAYARALEDSAQWTLAVDVYATVLRISGDAENRLNCFLRLGQCHRNLGTLSMASRAFRKANRLARESGDVVGFLRAQMGFTRLAILRGNLPLARRRNRAVLERATKLQAGELHSRASHDRAEIALLEGRFEDGLLAAYDALSLCGDSRERERIRCDIGYVFLKLGLHEAAKYVYCGLAIQAKEKVVRLAAIGNLLEIASLTNDKDEFTRHSRELEKETLPPQFAANLHLILGAGYVRFGDSGLGAVHLKSAIALASEHGFNQLLIEAERQLESASSVEDVLGTHSTPRGFSLRKKRRAAPDVESADAVRLQAVHSRALHESSEIALLQGKYEEGLQAAYEALALCTDSRERERISGDIGAAFLNLGMNEAARYAYSCLAIQAKERVVRAIAFANLVELASRSADPIHFARFAIELEGQQLPPYVAANVQLVLGVGHSRFGNSSLAIIHLKSAIALASEHGYNQVLVEAEQTLESARLSCAAADAVESEAGESADEDSSEEQPGSSELNSSSRRG